MLVLLRLNIGWHFFSEGMSHYADPHWSSAGFLRAATGPLAPRFQAFIPDYHGFERTIRTGDAAAVEKWFEQTESRLTDLAKRFGDFYQFGDQQETQANELLALRTQQFSHWLEAEKENFATHVHERDRLAKAKADPTAQDVPFQKSRIAQKEAELKTEADGWLAYAQGLEKNFREDLAGLRTDEQRSRGDFPTETPQLRTIDNVMIYGIMGIGACLILGLFTRLACVLGALFLVSVVLTQPFWVSTAQPTFNQWVEMFALLTLATTRVGKWGGFDFFIGCLFGGCCGGKCDTK